MNDPIRRSAHATTATLARPGSSVVPGSLRPQEHRELQDLHGRFASELSVVLSKRLQLPVHVEPSGFDELTYRDYVEALPDPSFLGVASLDPLPGSAIVELSPHLGFSLVDRLLGGAGTPIPLRRPTDLEIDLVRPVLATILEPLASSLAPLADLEPRLVRMETNPLFADAAAPREPVLVFTFTLLSTTPPISGDLAVVYPISTLMPALVDRRHARGEPEGEGGLVEVLPSVEVTLTVRSAPTTIAAHELWGLAPGDVVTLDHAVDEPFIADAGGHPALAGRLGRRRDRLAFQVTEPLFLTEDDA